jgi:multiple sugar transport system substrate-binding protein
MRQFLVLLFLAVLIGGFMYIEGIVFRVPEPDQNTLVVAVYPNLDVAFGELIPGFEKLHPGKKIQLRKLGFNDHHSTLQIEISAGKGAPDVAAVEIGFVGLLGGGGGFVDLLPAPCGAGVFRSNIVPYAWAQGTVHGNQLVALPIDIAPGCIYYRKDVLDRLKVDPAEVKTMEDYFALGKKVVRDDNGDGKPDQWLVPNASYIFNMIFYSDTIRYFDADGKPALDRPLVHLAMRWAKKFRDAGYDAQIGDWSNEWYAMLREGRLAFFPMGTWLTGHLRDWIAPKEAGKFRVAELPALEAGKQRMNISWGGSFLAITRQSAKRDLAWEFVKYVATTVRGQMVSFHKADVFPSWMPAWTEKTFAEGMPYMGGQKARELWINLARAIPPVQTWEKDNVANTILMDALTSVLDGKLGIAQALREAQASLENKMRIR